MILCVAAKPLIQIFMDQPEIVPAGVSRVAFSTAWNDIYSNCPHNNLYFPVCWKSVRCFLAVCFKAGSHFAVVIFAASKAIGYNGVIAAQPVSDFLTAVLAVVLFKKQLGDFLNRNNSGTII